MQGPKTEELIRILNSLPQSQMAGSIRLFSAPGRINIIGEHVDYAGGIVLPAAIDFRISAAVRTNGTNLFRIYSLDYDSWKISETLQYDPIQTWSNYVLGVVSEAGKIGLPVPGFDLAFGGNIPQGAGLSSSAALEVVTAYSLSELFGWNLSKTKIALLGQSAENRFVGVNCGIMDQFVISVAKPESCISLDTETLEYEYISLEWKDCELVLIDSKVKHSLKDSEYNDRRKETESALEKLKKIRPTLTSLYHAEEEWLDESKELTPREMSRALHVIGERKRTHNVIRSLQKGDAIEVGKSLYSCHDSLSRLFEVSCPETDYIVDWMKGKGVMGARMIGGGFGGCVLVLDRIGRGSSLFSECNDAYSRKFGVSADIYPIKISEGVREER
ncbi:galactokinase [Leptospira fluminis]|uniref:Galactokinase n=1 Tax=Leptospira fluminis TaxID=2484979 RepID=A0A4R9GTS2_9LEPT|nr:galactokinase [Leptospira fluminis]